MDLYTRSAPYYDLVYRPFVEYEREAELLEDIFERHAQRPVGRILDLGCGTGNHALALAPRGYEILGVDRSEAFVSIAREKSRGLEEGPRFVVGDMQDLGATGRFDALICMFGAFSHLSHEEARDALPTFRDRVEPGGVLAFEWWNEPGARDGYQDWLEREGEGIRLIRLGESKVDAEGHTLRMTLKHLVLRGDRLEDTFTEEATVALYQVGEMEELLSQAGFTPVAMLDWVRKALEPARPDDFRVFAVARRDR